MQIYLHIFLLFFFAEGKGFEPPRQLITDLMLFKSILFTNLSKPPKYSVGLKGLEPIRLSALAPKASVATITPQSEN